MRAMQDNVLAAPGWRAQIYNISQRRASHTHMHTRELMHARNKTAEGQVQPGGSLISLGLWM